MNAAQREDRALEAWCNVVGRIESSPIDIVERPDRDRPGLGGCDAIVRRLRTLQAVEHTTLDSYERRRDDDSRFRKVVMPIAPAIEAAFPDSWIELEVPVHAIPSGLNWVDLSSRLRDRCIDAIAQMPIASYYDLTRTRFDLPDIPFPVWISRQPSAGDRPSCILFRQAPGDRYEQLAADVSRALDDKSQQLSAYSREGKRTVLLIDFDDVVLLNRDLVATAFARAAAGRDLSRIDEVYLVDSGRRPPWVYPVKLDARQYPDLPEFGQFFSEQDHTNYKE